MFPDDVTFPVVTCCPAIITSCVAIIFAPEILAVLVMFPVALISTLFTCANLSVAFPICLVLFVSGKILDAIVPVRVS